MKESFFSIPKSTSFGFHTYRIFDFLTPITTLLNTSVRLTAGETTEFVNVMCCECLFTASNNNVPRLVARNLFLTNISWCLNSFDTAGARKTFTRLPGKYFRIVVRTGQSCKLFSL